MLDRFQVIGAQHGTPNLGYSVIFILATLYFIFGTVMVRKIKKVK
jgi:hypothetical protein